MPKKIKKKKDSNRPEDKMYVHYLIDLNKPKYKNAEKNFLKMLKKDRFIWTGHRKSLKFLGII